MQIRVVEYFYFYEYTETFKSFGVILDLRKLAKVVLRAHIYPSSSFA